MYSAASDNKKSTECSTQLYKYIVILYVSLQLFTSVLSWPKNTAILFSFAAVHPSERTTVFIYRAARSQAQGEFSQFETDWPSSMICGCYTVHHFPSSPPASGWCTVAGGSYEVVTVGVMASRPWRELMGNTCLMRLQAIA